CLVRGASAAIAMQRLVDASAALNLGAIDTNRVRVVTGDLSRPQIGLSDGTWAELVSTIGAVYHCGAEIDWIKPYSSLKDVNLGGTREIVRLSCEAFVPLHYVSTVGVFPLAEDAQLPFPEDADVADGDKLQLGYSQSKWAAERLLEHARSRGLEVTVYRPSFIAGDSRTGVEARSEHQLFYAFQAGCIQMGKVPAAEKVIDAVPVDWVAEAVVALSLDPRAANKRLNLINPRPVRQRAWYDILRQRGFDLHEVAYPRWREDVLALGPDNPLSRFSVYYKLMDEHRMARLEVQMAEKLPLDDSLARGLLDELDLRCPPLDERLLNVYLAYYQRGGLLPTLEPAQKPAESGAREVLDRRMFHVDHLPPALERTDAALWHLYEKGKEKQWNATSRIDWTVPLDPENPLETPDISVPLFGSDVYSKLTDRERAAVRRHYQAWQMSQFLHGEHLAVVAAARLVQLAPTVEFQLFAASQVMDEARHLEIYSRLLREKLELSYPMVEPFARLANSAMNDSRWDIIALGLQILVEGLALASFATFREESRNPLIRKIHAYVMEDEARHVAFGQKALSKYYPELTDRERSEREEFLIETSYMLRDRIMAVDAVWENVGLPVETCSRWIRESGFQRAWASALFNRIIPAIRAIGLWSPNVQKAYAQMGILGFGGVNLDDLVAQDEARAAELGGNHGS
ncbi:MAG TPA: thioester reductase domain-containing protein, partial [Polyangium sp.]|nr:thioester reductase domain-containing protein [Polyangium sp.]